MKSVPLSDTLTPMNEIIFYTSSKWEKSKLIDCADDLVYIFVYIMNVRLQNEKKPSN
jgi:hypothetical protein